MRAAPALLASALLLGLLLWLLPIFFGGASETATAELAPATREEALAHDPLVAEAREPERKASESPLLEPTSETALTPRGAPEASPTAAAEPLPDDLRILVVDGITRAPVPEVELLVSWEIQNASGHSTSGIRSGRTAEPSGELRIPRADVERRREQRGAEGHLLVRVKGLFAREVELRAKVEPWPTDPLEVALPPFAWIAFETIDELGRALDANGDIDLAPLETEARHLRERHELRDGRTARVICGIDISFHATGALEDGSTLERKPLCTPQSPGLTERHALRRERVGTSIALRLLRAPDEPLRSTEVRLSLESERRFGGGSMSSSSSSSQETDGEGWLRLVLEDPSGGEGLKRNLSLHVEATGREKRSAYVDLSREFPPGESVLGDLLLTEEPLLAAGHVVDRRGHPLAAIEVQAEALDGNGAELGGHWTGTQTDREGRFEIRTPAPAAKARLRARGRGYLDSPLLEVPAATTEVVITLDAAARLRGSVLLPEDMDPSSVTVHVAASGAERSRGLQARVAADRSFAIDELMPGTAKVSFLWRYAVELASVPDVHLIAGEENQDPRLQDLPLARDWRRLALRLLGPTGEILAGCECELRIDGERAGRVLRTDPQGHLDDWIPPEVERCTLQVEDHRALSVGWAPSRQDLRLEAGIRVTLPVEAELIPPIVDLHVSLAGERSSSSAPVRNGIAELVAPAPGTYEVRVQYTRQIGAGTLRNVLQLHPIVRVEVGPNDSQRLPALRIDAAQLRAALEAK